ncbi:hypothetical protein [Hyalangium rubrum]|uniref:Uncharacterized protein n=1 Tax=Hyalangium rubrum TaxID=3103134 RepID=A0ABU5HDE0_9BACT|nr:hypothetical protein [Hyalangium sp. s54d21]MDY7231485.1 hypothetical protein [Hyalangium sp. s54d21]
MIFNGTLTLITQVKPEAVEPLAALLRQLDQEMRTQEAHPFDGLEAIHFAHWSILEHRYLLFGADLCLEGAPPGKKARLQACVEQFVATLAKPRNADCAATFDTLYSHCVDYPGPLQSHPGKVTDYLRLNAVDYTARHVDFAYRVAPVRGIREIMKLRSAVEQHLDTPSLGSRPEQLEPRQVHETLRGKLEKLLSGELSDVRWERDLAAAQFEAASIRLGYLVPGFLLGLVVNALERLRKKEHTREYPEVSDRTRREIEARQQPVQNSMILITAIPESWFARKKQRFFLKLINLRLQRNVVGLNDIRTIHFARWLTFERNGQRRLIFMVAYDESWDAYIDSFIDNDDVSRFLKAIWSPTKGFPQGIPFVEPFKEWIRSVQSPTLAWYSAYRHGKTRLHADTSVGISVTDLHEALQLRRVLTRPSLHGLGNTLARHMLKTFLEQGRFPFQKKLMSVGESSYLVLAVLLSRLGQGLTDYRRRLHVALGKKAERGTLGVASQPALVAQEASRP